MKRDGHQEQSDSTGGMLAHLHARVGLIITTPVHLHMLECGTRCVSSELLKEGLAAVLDKAGPTDDGKYLEIRIVCKFVEIASDAELVDICCLGHIRRCIV